MQLLEAGSIHEGTAGGESHAICQHCLHWCD